MFEKKKSKAEDQIYLHRVGISWNFHIPNFTTNRVKNTEKSMVLARIARKMSSLCLLNTAHCEQWNDNKDIFRRQFE